MERRSFFKKSAIATAGLIIAGQANAKTTIDPQNKEFYELKIYQLTGSGKTNLKKYYTEAVIPHLRKWGAKVGAFEEYGLEEPPKVYMLHVYKNPMEYYECVQAMKTKSFMDSASAYLKLPATQPVFERYETLLLEAFDAIPKLRVPEGGRGLFELRIYESYNEDAGYRKVKMFNDEEIALFDKIGLSSVFFGQNMAGGYLPALTYMLGYKDMAEREALWAKFRASSEWAVMRVKPEYADTVSKVRKKFLIPLDYSEI